MASFGERLRREREMRKVSLQDIAAATKISTRNLRALEEEEFDKLPGGIFNKGFVRSYARFLGMNEDQAVADYLTAAGEEGAPSNVIVMEKLAAESERRAAAKRDSEPSSLPFNWKAVAGLLFVVGLAAAGWVYREPLKVFYAERLAPRPLQVQAPVAEQPAPPAQVPAITETQTTEPAPQVTMEAQEEQFAEAPVSVPPTQEQQTPVTPSAEAVPTIASAPAAPGPIRVVVKATEPSYLEARADDRPVRVFNLESGTVQSFAATSQLRLKVGNAAGVEVTWNGTAVPSLGERGQVKTVTFGPEGLIR